VQIVFGNARMIVGTSCEPHDSSRHPGDIRRQGSVICNECGSRVIALWVRH
jgi:hypothetical protein